MLPKAGVKRLRRPPAIYEVATKRRPQADISDTSCVAALS